MVDKCVVCNSILIKYTRKQRGRYGGIEWIYAYHCPNCGIDYHHCPNCGIDYYQLPETKNIESKREDTVFLEYYNWSEGGGAIIEKVSEGYVLWEVPLYGGKPDFYGFYETKDEAKKIADNWI